MPDKRAGAAGRDGKRAKSERRGRRGPALADSDRAVKRDRSARVGHFDRHGPLAMRREMRDRSASGSCECCTRRFLCVSTAGRARGRAHADSGAGERIGMAGEGRGRAVIE